MMGMIFDYIIDHIPLWGWVTIFGGIGAVAFYFLHPILIPLWRMMPTPLKIAFATVTAGVIAWLGGRYVGRQNAEEAERRRNAEALQKRTEVEHETATKPDSVVRQELRDKWSRD